MHALREQLWWIRRVVLIPVYLFLFTIVVFFLVRLIPGDPVVNAAGGQNLTDEQYRQMQSAMGLDGSLWSQLLTYLGNLLHGNLGTSFSTGAAVSDDLRRVIPGTLEVAVIAAVGILLLGFVVGSLVLYRPDGVVARAGVLVARTAGAVPDFVLGIFGILLFYVVLRIAPAPVGRYSVEFSSPPQHTGSPLIDATLAGEWGLVGSMFNHLWLPALTLVLAYGPMLLKVLLPALVDSAGATSTMFAVSTGQRTRSVLWSVWRRAMPAALAMFGTLFGYLLGGAVVVEQLFALQGSAEYAVNAVKRSDYVALQGMLLAIALISLIVFLGVDIITGLFDPRRRVATSNE